MLQNLDAQDEVGITEVLDAIFALEPPLDSINLGLRQRDKEEIVV